jgi:hypothetical protein
MLPVLPYPMRDEYTPLSDSLSAEILWEAKMADSAYAFLRALSTKGIFICKKRESIWNASFLPSMPSDFSTPQD